MTTTRGCGTQSEHDIARCSLFDYTVYVYQISTPVTVLITMIVCRLALLESEGVRLMKNGVWICTHFTDT